jgi:hypothetical protein
MKLLHARNCPTAPLHDGVGTETEVARRLIESNEWAWRLTLLDIQRPGVIDVGADSVADQVMLILIDGKDMQLHGIDATGNSGDLELERFNVVTLPPTAQLVVDSIDRPVRILMLACREHLQHPSPRLTIHRLDSGDPLHLRAKDIGVVLDGAIEIATVTGVFPYNPEYERVSRGGSLIGELMDVNTPPKAKSIATSVVAIVEASC